MRIILFLLLLFASTTAFGENINDVMTVLKKRNFSRFEQYLGKRKSDSHCASSYDDRVREILPGYREAVIAVMIFTPTPEGKYSGNCNYYDVDLLAYGDEVIMFEVRKNSASNNQYEVIDRYLNQELVKDFRAAYTKAFYREIRLDELFDKTISYGKACGIGGIDPDGQLEMIAYIREKNTDRLFNWLTSPSYEKKLYAYEGYKTLVARGYELNSAEKEIMEKLIFFKGEVSACSGCIFSREEFSFLLSSAKELDMEKIAEREREDEQRRFATLNKVADNGPKSNFLPVMLMGMGIGLMVVFACKYLINRFYRGQ